MLSWLPAVLIYCITLWGDPDGLTRDKLRVLSEARLPIIWAGCGDLTLLSLFIPLTLQEMSLDWH